MNNTLRKIVISVFGNQLYEDCVCIKNKIRYSAKNSSKYCPCCNTYLKEWSSFKKYQWVDSYNADLFELQKDNCVCPVCLSAPRQRIEMSWLNEQDLSNKKVLLWAPERSIKRFFKRKHIKIITADLYKDNVMKKENIEKTSFKDEEFDYIICNHVLEHVSNLKNALDDTFRILKKSGCALIMVPLDCMLDKTIEDQNVVDDEQRKKLYGQSDHLRLFGQDFDDTLKEAGFSVERFIGDEACGEEILPIVAPAKYDSNILFICKKGKVYN